MFSISHGLDRCTEMKMLRGVCSKDGDGSAVIGRIVPYRDAEKLCRTEAVLAVANENTPITPRDGMVGIIRISSCERPAGEAFTGITLPYLPDGCLGKIALLDTASHTLFVSPDLSTVNRYTSKVQSTDIIKKDAPLLSAAQRVGIFPYFKSDAELTECSRCILEIDTRECDEKDIEEYLFERLRDAAENASLRPLAVVSSSKKNRTEEIRATMRSGVYGNVSMLLGNIRSESELTEALSALCHAFCELELENREFNGYMPRGLLIDTPYLLCISKKLRGVDIFVYDIPALAKLLVGNEKDIPLEAIAHLCEKIRELTKERQDVGHRIITDGTLLPHDCLRVLLSCGISEFFSLPRNIPKLCDTMEKILK